MALLWAEANKTLWYTPTMPAKPVQISLDADLLERIDQDPETRAEGRSAFVRKAVEGYLAVKRRRQIDAQIAAAYGRDASGMLADAADLMDAQAWPVE
jgi:metal-responsive CopG/Arc/MetJ family transcriptional regulator